MSAVTGIDDRDRRMSAGNHRRTFLWMSHRTDICIAGNHADCVDTLSPLAAELEFAEENPKILPPNLTLRVRD